MTKNRRGLFAGVAVSAAIFLAVIYYCVLPPVLFRYHLRIASAFCKRVATLPQLELADFASRCDLLWSERGGSAQGDITDTNILNRFMLLGHRPEIIYVDSHMVSVHFLRSGRSGAIVNWMDHSQWGEPVWKLETAAGDIGGGVLYVAAKRLEYQIGSPSGSQPIRPETNQTSAAAGSGR